MTGDEVIQVFRDCGALLEGHFLFTSGRHGSAFLQAARVLQYPEHTDRLCGALADQFRDAGVELVVGPATGGIVLAYATARALGARAAYTEKNGDGGMALKRGIRVDPGVKVLVVEDITTTGGSVQKSVEHLQKRGADVRGVGVLIDRSGGTASFDCPFVALAQLSLDSWAPASCPLCASGAKLIEPDDLSG